MLVLIFAVIPLTEEIIPLRGNFILKGRRLSEAYLRTCIKNVLGSLAGYCFLRFAKVAKCAMVRRNPGARAGVNRKARWKEQRQGPTKSLTF